MSLSEQVLEAKVIGYDDQLDVVLTYLNKKGSLFKDSKEQIAKAQKMKGQKVLSKNDKDLIANLYKNVAYMKEENLSESIINLNEAKITRSQLFSETNKIYTSMRNLVNKLSKDHLPLAQSLNKIAENWYDTASKAKI